MTKATAASLGVRPRTRRRVSVLVERSDSYRSTARFWLPVTTATAAIKHYQPVGPGHNGAQDTALTSE